MTTEWVGRAYPRAKTSDFVSTAARQESRPTKLTHYPLACGLADGIDYLQQLRFEQEELVYLAALVGHDGRPLLEKVFLDYLQQFRFTCDVDAVPEGTVVFPQEPLLRVQGPILQAQLVETALLNLINFQSLIATKAARVCLAAHGEPVIEFGLRRAQGADGGLAAARAA